MKTGSFLPGNPQEEVPDPGSYFTINSISGDIEVQRTIDREEVKEFIMTIVASDNPTQGKRHSTSGNATIVIKDVNDNPPKCNPKKVVCNVSESFEKGKLLPETCKVNCPDKVTISRLCKFAPGYACECLDIAIDILS